jgi:hypothetical protein
MELNNPFLRQYRDIGYRTINGFVDEHHLYFLDFLDSLDINKKGGVAEIGVHHGKFYIPLNALVERDFSSYVPSYAIDVFEDQHLNIDNSGRGNQELFEKNLHEYDRYQGENTIIIKGDSTDSRQRLTSVIDPGSLKFISVDGGHTAAHALNDLKISNEIISNEGVVIVDDFLHSCWLGVTEGVVEFLRTKPTLVPFAFGKNKLYMCKLSYVEYYKSKMMNYPFRNDHWTYFMGYQIFPFFV